MIELSTDLSTFVGVEEEEEEEEEVEERGDAMAEVLLLLLDVASCFASFLALEAAGVVGDAAVDAGTHFASASVAIHAAGPRSKHAAPG